MDCRHWLFSACAAVLIVLPALLPAVAQDVTITTCKGDIASSFKTLRINARWEIDWPECVNHISPHAMTAIRKQICADTFGILSNDGDEDMNGLFAERLDYAQLALFRRAVIMVAETEDMPCMRALDFHAFLKILFVTDGYIGYRLDGCHNEGGNGCHSYVISRVLSLATGRPLYESDLIATNRFPELYAHIVRKACGDVDVKPFDSEPKYSPQSRLFDTCTFMIEPEGIRWFLPPYSVFPGCAGVVDSLVTWDELKPFFAETGYWNALRELHVNTKTVTRKE